MNLHNFVIRCTGVSQVDLTLCCKLCGEHICDLEDGDSLDVLVDMHPESRCHWPKSRGDETFDPTPTRL